MAVANVFNFGIGLSFNDDDVDKTIKKLDGITKHAAFMGKTLSRIGGALDFTSLVPRSALDLQDAVGRIAAETDGLDKTARATSDAIFDMAVNEGYASSSSLELASALAATGQSLTDVGSRKALGGLVDLFGVTGEEAAALSAGVKILGIDVESLADQTADLQSRSGVAGGFGLLPELVTMSRQAIVSFGKAVVGSGPKLVKTLQRIGTVSAMTFGVGMTQGIAAAQAMFGAFSGELLTARRYLIGLAGDAGPGIRALYEIGDSFDQARERLRQGQDDPINFVKGIIDETNRLDEIQAARVIEQLVDAFQGTDVAEYLRNTESLNKAIEAQYKVGLDRQRGLRDFGDVVDSLQTTGKGALRVFDTLLSVIGDGIGVIISEITGKSMKDANSIVGFFVGHLNDFRENVINSGTFTKRFLPVLRNLGTVAIFAGKAVALIAGAFTSVGVGAAWIKTGMATGSLARMGKVAKTAAGGVKILSGAIWNLGKNTLGKLPNFIPARLLGFFGLIKDILPSGGRVAELLGKMGPKFLKFLPFVGQVILGFHALRDAGKTMFEVLAKGPAASSGDRFIGVIRSIGAGAIGLLDGLLFGIPSMIARTFFGVEDTLGMAFGRMLKGVFKNHLGRDLSDIFHDVLVGIGVGIKDLIVGIKNALTGATKAAGSGTKSFMVGLGEDIAYGVSGILGGLIHVVLEGSLALLLALAKVTRTFAVFIGEGIADGIKEGFDIDIGSMAERFLQWSTPAWIQMGLGWANDQLKTEKERNKEAQKLADTLQGELKAVAKTYDLEAKVTKEKKAQLDLAKAASGKREKTLAQQCKELAERERQQALLRRVKLGIENPGLIEPQWKFTQASMPVPQVPRDKGGPTTGVPSRVVVAKYKIGDGVPMEIGEKSIKALSRRIAVEQARKRLSMPPGAKLPVYGLRGSGPPVLEDLGGDVYRIIE